MNDKFHSCELKQKHLCTYACVKVAGHRSSWNEAWVSRYNLAKLSFTIFSFGSHLPEVKDSFERTLSLNCHSLSANEA